MEQNLSKVSVSLENGSFEVSGSEEFVKEQVKSITELLQNYRTNSPAPTGQKGISAPVSATHGDNPTPEGLENVISFYNEKINIIAEIPGKTTAKKVRNVALLYLYGNHVYKNADEVGAEEIRNMCEKHACLDGNFAVNLKGNKSLFIVDGGKNGKKQQVKITVPGLKAAEKLAKDINAPKAE